MANNYQQWCEEFEYPKGHEAEARVWLEGTLKTDYEELEPKALPAWCPEGYLEFQHTVREDGFVLYAEDSGNIDAAVALVQELWRRFGDGSELAHISWANLCDKMRPGNFSGGIVVFTRDRAEWADTCQLQEQLTKKLRGG